MQKDTSKAEEARDLQRQVPQTRPMQSPTRFGWWWETASIILSIASMVALIVVLVSVNDKPLPHWRITGNKPTPNVIVAILSTIAKSSLIFPLAECLGQLKWAYFEKRARPVHHLQAFDGATRGPWGSWLFLLEIKGKAILASLGAIVTILALSFDPFTQLALDYPQRMHHFTNETGSLSVSRKWLNGNDGGSSEADSNLYIPVTVGVLTALGNQDYTPLPNYGCPKSECRAQNIATLGVCSSCDTKTIVNTEFDDCKVDFFKYGFNQGLQDNSIENGSYDDLLQKLNELKDESPDYTLQYLKCQQNPDGFPSISFWLNVQSTVGESTSGGLAQPQPPKGAYSLTQGFFWSTDPNNPGHIQNYTDSIANTTLRFCTYESPTFDEAPTTSLIRASCFTSNTDLTLYQDILKVGQINGTVHTCDLQICERRYDAVHILNGNKTYTGLQQNKLVPQKRASDDNVAHQSATVASGSDAVYDAGSTAWRDTQSRFRQVADPTSKDNNASDWHIVHSILAPTNRTNGTAIDDFPHLFDRFADVLSSAIQSSGNPDAENMTMDVYDLETYVAVRWAYLTMPIFIVLFATLFLVISIVQSRRQDYLLKNSSLAVMYHGLDVRDLGHEYSDGEQGVRTVVTENDLVQESKMISAIFAYDEGRMRLKKD